MKINDPPPAFSSTRMNRSGSGIKFLQPNICKFAKCTEHCTWGCSMRWLSGLLPTSRQLIKLNHLQHSKNLTSTRVWLMSSPGKSTFYTHLHFTRLMHGHSFMWDMNSTLTFVELDTDIIVHCCGCFETYVRASEPLYVRWCMYRMILEFLEMSTVYNEASILLQNIL